MNRIRDSVVFKSIFGIVLLLVIYSVIVSIVGVRNFTEVMLEQYADGAFRTANTAAYVFNPDDLDDFLATKCQSGEAKEAVRKVEQICHSSGATFIYVILPDQTDYKHITFVFSTVNKNYDYDVYESGYVRETTNDDYRQKYKELYEENSRGELVIRDKGYIETDAHITAMIPLKGAKGRIRGILCVQRQLDKMVDARMEYMKKVGLIFCMLALIVIIGQGLYLNQVLLFPMVMITKEADRFAEESTVPDRKLKDIIRNKDEIGRLAQTLDQLEEEIVNHLDELTRMTAARERITTELSLATRIQASMLPSEFPAFPDRSEFDIYASMIPARDVGGDFYDFFLLDEDHLYMVMADVSGKGIPAALFMMVSRVILASNAKSSPSLPSPAELLKRTNDLISPNNQEDMFVTVWLGILEISTGKIVAANAGHEYPVIMESGGGFSLYKDKHSFIVGAMEGVNYHDYEIHLKPGSKLFLYTDGVPEACNEEGAMFGTDRMIAALNMGRKKNPEELIHHVQEAVDRYKGEAEQFDDETMLCLEYKGS